MLHKFYATRELNIGDKPTPKGALVATIDTDLDVDRVINGMISGHLTRNASDNPQSASRNPQ